MVRVSGQGQWSGSASASVVRAKVRVSSHLLARKLLHWLAALSEALQQTEAVEQRGSLVRGRVGGMVGGMVGVGVRVSLGRQSSRAAACGAAATASAVSASAARSMACAV